MKRILIFLLTMCCGLSIVAQETYPQNGVYDHREEYFAFTGVTVHVSPQQTIENATLVIKEGKIENVGAGISVPKGAVVYEMEGKHIYPSFIELHSNYGMPEPQPIKERGRFPQTLSNKKGAYHWNEAIRPEFNAHEIFTANEKSAKEMRKVGFGTVLTHQFDGISRGSSSVVTLGNDKENLLFIKDKASHNLSFRKGTSTQNYPSSLMGGIALLRQTYYDAKWYASQKDEEYNISLEAWNELQSLPQIFAVRDRLDIFRADKIAKEFNVKYIYKGNGDEYMRIDAIKKTGSSLIIPVDFPEPYDVSDPFDAMNIALDDMKHWELAPTNPAALAKANITFAFTSNGLKSKASFLKNIKTAIEYGLTEEQALAALTTNPAKMIGIDREVGTLERGKLAHFIVTDKPIFEDDAKIYQNWVGAQGFVLKTFDEEAPIGEGVYRLKVGKKSYKLHVRVKDDKPSFTIHENDSTEIKVKYSYSQHIISLTYTEDEQLIRLSGTASKTKASGQGQNAKGEWIDWAISPTREALEKKEDKKEDKKEEKEEAEQGMELGTITYPFLPYGWEETPKAQTVLIKNTTVWTNEADGIMENTDVLISNGKIKQIGKNLSVSADKTIDGTGKHLTCGIIDEHSHIAISRGVNEGTQYSSAEVSIGDVVNSEDVNIYRNLSGGVTAAQLLHGSANPIGGQSGIIKMKWGFTPEEMKIDDATPFIKFALGENVKQSNWGDYNTTRFPQTRMGVEEVYDDHFTRAKEYGQLKRSGKPYRVDLEMETLLQILEKKRFITCHSYVQSEINMLMKVADRHGFTLNTFTHILEGYKVADKMKDHGAGGSTFSDWWAYKYEVIDAIPYNAAILTKMGVVTAINSDDAEMSRRLNQEAAKAVMYGNLTEEEAWKLVTLNPAKLLHLDDQMGSIKVGKDADLVLWSDNPLSIYSKAEQTYVDGLLLFDKDRDLELRDELRAERNRLVQKMLGEKEGGAKTRAPRMKRIHHYHCDHVHDEMGEEIHHHHEEEGH